MFGNCFSWAIPKWLRGYFQGKSLVVRKSLISWVPHAMVVDCLKNVFVEEYIPQHFSIPQKIILKQIPIHTMLFRGRVRKGLAICFCPDCVETMEKIQCNCPKCKEERDNGK